jgi:hypothetical protein
MLLCKQDRCFWYTVYITSSADDGTASASRNWRVKMSKTVAIAFSPVSALFGRLLAGIDHVLLTNAAIAVRNGDVPRIGL